MKVNNQNVKGRILVLSKSTAFFVRKHKFTTFKFLYKFYPEDE